MRWSNSYLSVLSVASDLNISESPHVYTLSSFFVLQWLSESHLSLAVPHQGQTDLLDSEQWQSAHGLMPRGR